MYMSINNTGPKTGSIICGPRFYNAAAWAFLDRGRKKGSGVASYPEPLSPKDQGI